MHAIWSLLVAFLWASSGVIKKSFLADMSADAMMVAVGIINGIIALVYGLWAFKAKEWSTLLTPQRAAALTLTTLMFGFIANLIYYRVLKANNAHTVIALSFTAPAFALLLAVAFLGERPTAGAIAGTLLVTAGIALIAWSRPTPFNS